MPAAGEAAVCSLLLAKTGTTWQLASGSLLTAPAAGKSWAFTTKALTPVTAFPSATKIYYGSLRSGTYSRLGSDDNNHYQVNSTTSGTRVRDWYGAFSAVPIAL